MGPKGSEMSWRFGKIRHEMREMSRAFEVVIPRRQIEWGY